MKRLMQPWWKYLTALGCLGGLIALALALYPGLSTWLAAQWRTGWVLAVLASTASFGLLYEFGGPDARSRLRDRNRAIMKQVRASERHLVKIAESAPLETAGGLWITSMHVERDGTAVATVSNWRQDVELNEIAISSASPGVNVTLTETYLGAPHVYVDGSGKEQMEPDTLIVTAVFDDGCPRPWTATVSYKSCVSQHLAQVVEIGID